MAFRAVRAIYAADWVTPDQFVRFGAEDGMPLGRELRDGRIPFVVATGFDGHFGLPDVLVVQKPYNAMQVVRALQAARETSRKA